MFRCPEGKSILVPFWSDVPGLAGGVNVAVKYVRGYLFHATPAIGVGMVGATAAFGCLASACK